MEISKCRAVATWESLVVVVFSEDISVPRYMYLVTYRTYRSKGYLGTYVLLWTCTVHNTVLIMVHDFLPVEIPKDPKTGVMQTTATAPTSAPPPHS